MILTFLGKIEHMSNQELRELLQIPNLNGINKSEIAIELYQRDKFE